MEQTQQSMVYKHVNVLPIPQVMSSIAHFVLCFQSASVLFMECFQEHHTLTPQVLVILPSLQSVFDVLYQWTYMPLSFK